ncbi:site-2 protease family protein [Clostridium ihumii]|uniref:site-2 protease family protein n=1 Tax=Clostridium ihumii TaxID=1470356 RepID=UPI00058E921B|nr:site-2 protease family protein [Clostridium ihumii]
MSNRILGTILLIPAILVAITFHEYAHAWMAVKLGDDTPKYQGRLTLDPLAHIDIAGFVMMLIFHFGWGKAVQTNPNNFKNYYKDDLKVSIAGPLANFFCAIVGVVLMNILYILPISHNNNLYIIINQIVYNVAFYNCLWMILNLLPLPGFDGFHILRDLFPKQFFKFSDNIYRYQFIILIVMIMPIFGGYSLLSLLISRPASYIFYSIVKIVGMIF